MVIISVIIALLIINVNNISAAKTTGGITTQHYCSPDDTKCITKFEYDTLMDSYIKLIAVKIQKNNTDEAIKILNAVPPVDDVRILKIVEQTMTRSDFQLIFLLQFINQTTTSPNASLNYFNNIFHGMNNNGTRTLLDWLDLKYFLTNSFSEYKNIEVYKTLLSDIQTNAKNVLMMSEYVVGWFSSYCSKEKYYQPRHLSFIVESYLNKDYENIENVTIFLAAIDSLLYRFLGFIELFNQMENSGHLSKTFTLIPSLKYLADFSYKRDLNADKQRRIEEFFQKLPNKSVMKTILSNEYFVLRNVYNKGYLYSKHSKRFLGRTTLKPKQENLLKTVSNFDTFSEELNWKFSVYHAYNSKEPELKLINEFGGSEYNLLAVECSVDASVLQMKNENQKNYAWILETDDFFSDRFRIKNANTDEYLGVRITTDNDQLEPNVFLVTELNTENFDSVHWTLELPVKKSEPIKE